MRDFADKLDNTAPAASGILGAQEDNVRFREMKNAVSTSGQTLDGPTGPDTYFYMLAEAIARYASGGVLCQDGGGADTYILTSIGGFKLPRSYFRGQIVAWYPAATSTGPSQINVGGVGLKKLCNSVGGDTVAGDVAASTLTMATYDPALNSGAGAFKLCPWSMPMRSVGGGTPVYEGLAQGRHKIRSLMAGSNITIDLVEYPASSGEYKIRIASSGGGGGGGTLTDGDKGDITVMSSATVWTIDPNVVDNAKLAQMAANTIKGRLGTLGNAQDLTGTQVMSILPDATSGTKGAVTPDGNVAHYLNGQGNFTIPPASFPIHPAIGSYTIIHASASGSSIVVGETRPATGSGSWYITYGLSVPSGVWMVAGVSTLNESSGSGGTSETVLGYLMLMQRTA